MEGELADKGRVVLRASGTEPVVRVMVEGRDMAQVERLSRSPHGQKKYRFHRLNLDN